MILSGQGIILENTPKGCPARGVRRFENQGHGGIWEGGVSDLRTFVLRND